MATASGPTTFNIFAPKITASRTDDGRMHIVGVASSTVQDHHGDQITLKALKQMRDTAMGLAIFMNHRYDVPKDVLGSVDSVELLQSADKDPKTGAQIWDLKISIAIASSNPDAVATFNLIDADKVHLGISIGAMIPDGGAVLDKKLGRYVIDDIELLEASAVGIPANPRSFVDYAFKSLAGFFPEKGDGSKSDVRAAEKRRAMLASFTGADVPEATEDSFVPDVVDGIELDADGNVTDAAAQAIIDAVNAPGAKDLLEALSTDFDESHFAGETPEIAKSLAGITLDQFVEGDGVIPQLSKADWSTAYKDKLPASAFACPKQRAYPHHDENGAVDPAHLRASLSRVADPDNVQCAGAKAHLEAHAKALGIGGHEKGLEPDVTKADGQHTHPHSHVHDHEHTHGWGLEADKVTHSHEHAHSHSHEHDSMHAHEDTFDGNGHNHWHEGDGKYDDADSPDDHAHQLEPADTDSQTNKSLEAGTGAHSAQDSTPDIAGGTPIAAAVAPEGTDLVKSLTAQLSATRQENATLRKDRDDAIRMARTVMADAQRIMDAATQQVRDAMMPAGRKIKAVAEAQDALNDLGNVYSAEVRKLMSPTKKG
jgi:hypothetical protein